MGEIARAYPSHKTSMQLKKNLILDAWKAGNNLNDKLQVSLWVRRGNNQVLPFFPVSQTKAPEGVFATGLHNKFLLSWVPACLCPPLLLLCTCGMSVQLYKESKEFADWELTLKKYFSWRQGVKAETVPFTRNSDCSSQHAAITSETSKLAIIFMFCCDLYFVCFWAMYHHVPGKFLAAFWKNRMEDVVSGVVFQNFVHC